MDYIETYNKIIQHLKDKQAMAISNVEKAFEVASELHKNQFRKSGEPYIMHPIEVAHILEKMDFDTNVICGGLLHDTVEDCNYTIADIEKNFNPTIAKIVDGVTAIEGNLDNLSEDEFPKFLEQVQTYQKLITVGKENLFAFYIKFADRLHNLKTISCFPHYKQMAKVKETEQWIYPILKLLNANEFYRQITNECFKIQNQEMQNFDKIYSKYFDYNQENTQELKEKLNILLNSFQRKKKMKNTLQKISIKPCTELEVFNLIKNVMGVRSLNEIKQSYLNKFPITKMYLVFNNNKSVKELNTFLLDFLQDNNIKNILRICGYGVEENTGKPYITLVDAKRIKYQCYIFNSKDYLIYKNGTTDGVDLNFVDESTEEVSGNYIQVRTRSGEIIKMPENSTILDFAFKIHKDFGFSVKYAFLNDAPTKSPIYLKLSDGDKVNLVVERDNEGNCKNISQIRWIMYAKTDQAQKALVQYFENKSLK